MTEIDKSVQILTTKESDIIERSLRGMNATANLVQKIFLFANHVNTDYNYFDLEDVRGLLKISDYLSSEARNAILDALVRQYKEQRDSDSDRLCPKAKAEAAKAEGTE